MNQRVVTAIVALVALLIVLFALPPVIAKLVIAALLLAGAWEWSGFFSGARTPLRIVYVAAIAVLFWIFVVAMPEYAGQLLLAGMV
ncbi:MAG: hypothetical protein OEN22_04740, partial [Gammaproteobacteria bacterium]|nr:hypothetical protein [Gammaproteobacteria bacterium]